MDKSTQVMLTLAKSGRTHSTTAARNYANFTSIGPSRMTPGRPLLNINPPSRKGKEREVFSFVPGPGNLVHPACTVCIRQSLSQRRYFHASSRRDALPLVPAALGLLKSTSILAAATAISRVLLSLFPLGTIAAFRMNKRVKYVQRNSKPEASEEAEDFWRMWCDGERPKRLTKEEARGILAGTSGDKDSIIDKKGRVAHLAMYPPGTFTDVHEEYITRPNEQVEKCGRAFRGRLTHGIQDTRFFLPDLPPDSIPYHERLSPKQQEEVQSLRIFHISLWMFKRGLWWSRRIMMTILGLPCFLLIAVYLCALEQVPLTGRWRIILLTPEEEDTISSSLAGNNWYKSVINLLTTAEQPAPPIVPIEDWRWRWVQDTLRRLESAIVAECHGQPQPSGPPVIAIPPAQHPLKPRPRVSSMLHSALPGGEPSSGKEHLELGPPYSLMIMQKDEKNAFSYGFGGKGAGGIVVYTGLLDSILRQHAAAVPEEPAPQPPASGGFFSGLFSSPSPPRNHPVQPTEAQTLHLASILAHEMGHLLLSHHLETLSQQQVLWPSILGLAMDFTRAFIWPFTLFLGPTINDALANMGKTSANEMTLKYGHIGFQWKHEYEADLAGMRILALAGFNPDEAVANFSQSVADLHEIPPLEGEEDRSLLGRSFKLWTTATHPSAEQRVLAIEAELERWKKESRVE